MLSLCILTKNSARYLERLLRIGRAFADELVVAVDATSSDATADIARRHADKLFRVETPTYAERALAWLNERCAGDWILRLDDDELPSAGLVAALPRLLRDREVTHYWLPRRWVAGPGCGRWLAERPWWPDWQLRLFRNIRSLVQVPGGLHTGYVVQGAGRYFGGGCIYHLDLVYHSESARREKVARYDACAPGSGLAHYYLPPAGAALATRPVDDDPFAELRPGFVGRSIRGRIARRPARAAGCDRGALEHGYGPEVFRAHLDAQSCPTHMKAGSWCGVNVGLRNASPVAWPFAGLGAPEVRLAYHWLRPGGAVYEHEGQRTTLPHTLRPGQTANLFAAVRAPRHPGRFILRWDLVIEHVAWFSARGWRGPEAEIRVER
jgi:hypothetical protein